MTYTDWTEQDERISNSVIEDARRRARNVRLRKLPAIPTGWANPGAPIPERYSVSYFVSHVGWFDGGEYETYEEAFAAARRHSKKLV